jgi:multicomponent Na+:H+ antiporter subunit D
MNLVIVLPIVIPLLSAAVSLLAWRRVAVQRAVALVGTIALLLAGLLLMHQVTQHDIVVSQMGQWEAPYGITLVADRLSAMMVLLAGVCAVAVVVYSLGSMDPGREAFGYYPLLHTLLMGVCGAFLTGDVFNLYVWFEVMLMASFVLLALGDEPPQIRGAIKYVTMNLLASAVFLAAVGILYGVVGTLNMADLARKLSTVADQGTVTTLSMLFLIAFGVKAAVFPLFFWLPASYHTPPVAVTAIFAGLLTKVGVYALIRVFTLIFVYDDHYTHTLLLVLAGFTMVTGVLGAAAQYEIRRILSFHIISQIGYMIMGLAIAGLTESPRLKVLALAGSIFYIAHHILVKTNLFLLGGIMERLGGTADLKRLGGLYRTHPGIAFLFLIPAMSLAGMPPLSGFFAKLSLVQAGLQAEQYIIVAVALAVGLLTLFSMMKIWSEACWKSPPEPLPLPVRMTRSEFWLRLAPVVFMAGLTITIGLAAEPVFQYSKAAAEQLVDRQAYISAVLGEDE